MTEFELKHVDVQRDRRGRVRYYYFRRNGRRWPLPGEPLSEAFMDAYRRLLQETDPKAPERTHGHPLGSFGALVGEYLKSGEFRDLKPRTQGEYRRVLEALAEQHGQKPVARLERQHIVRMKNAKADTPGAANTIIRMMKVILTFAVELGMIPHNPALRIKLRKVGEWRAWSDEECATFEARWPSGTTQRRAYALAVFTGQRKTDVVAMTRADRKDGYIHVAAQSKTGEELWIPEHHDLTAELARSDNPHLSLLTTSQGKAFDPVYFGAWFAEAIEAAGLPEDLVLHGLRKTAARRLAEAGCTDEEIMAIIGHRTRSMVSRYTKSANKKRNASAAILKLENSK